MGCRIAVTELVPGRRVTWLVLENDFDFIADKSEWVSNAMVFDIAETDAGTQLRFTQVGLVPDYECYDVCSNAWGFYLNGSLRGLITTGQGSPNATGRANFAAEEVRTDA